MKNILFPLLRILSFTRSYQIEQHVEARAQIQARSSTCTASIARSGLVPWSVPQKQVSGFRQEAVPVLRQTMDQIPPDKVSRKSKSTDSSKKQYLYCVNRRIRSRPMECPPKASFRIQARSSIMPPCPTALTLPHVRQFPRLYIYLYHSHFCSDWEADICCGAAASLRSRQIRSRSSEWMSRQMMIRPLGRPMPR
jgi:hypothetical protein